LKARTVWQYDSELEREPYGWRKEKGEGEASRSHGGFLHGDWVAGALKIPNSKGPNAKEAPITNDK
jgi:hypothetical protein